MTPALQPGTERPNIAPVTRLLLALAATLAFPLAAFSQPYPSQPVRVMVGFPQGGTTDIIGRLTANELSEQLGKPFVVENRGGASGTIGAGVVAKSAPDGHSLLLAPSTHGTVRALYASLPYEESDFAVIGLIASTPYVFVVHPDMPVKTFGELIALLKANPGKYNYASTSPGTSQHLGGELVKKMAGVDMVHIAYKGTGAVMPDLLSGRVPMMFE